MKYIITRPMASCYLSDAFDSY